MGTAREWREDDERGLSTEKWISSDWYGASSLMLCIDLVLVDGI